MTAPALLKRLAIVVGVLYLALSYVAFVRLGGISGGLKLMDLRAEGYDHAAVLTYLETLGAEGRALYRDTYALLDAVFMLALTSFLLSLGWAFRSRRVAWLGAIAALGYLGFDIFENTRIFAMMSAREATITVAQVEAASLATQCKFASLAIACLCLFIGWRQTRSEGREP